jgi:hypothetical protein
MVDYCREHILLQTRNLKKHDGSETCNYINLMNKQCGTKRNC